MNCAGGGAGPQFRIWFLPSWLGIDAPCVVSTWTMAIAMSLGCEFQWSALAALFLTVWCIYLLDRLVDVSLCSDWSNVTGRMWFGRCYRRLLLSCLVGAATGLCVLVFSGSIDDRVMVRGLIVAGGMVVYVMLFVVPVLCRRFPGKEFGVGLFFAAGATAVLGFSSSLAPLLVTLWLLVTYNCLIIGARDRESDAAIDSNGAGQWWPSIDRDLVIIGAVLIVGAIVAGMFIGAHSFFACAGSAFALLLTLHCFARNLSGDAVRAVADFALFTPLILALVPDTSFPSGSI